MDRLLTGKRRGRLPGAVRGLRPGSLAAAVPLRGRKRRRGTGLPLATAAVGLLAGVGAMFMLDPQAGRRRRALARDKAVRVAHRSSKRVTRTGRALSSAVHATRQRTLHALRRRPATPVDDHTLESRIESTVFRDPGVPKGAINITVEEGVAVLRGAVERPEQIGHIERRVKKVPGVRGVENLLHMVNTDAPNKEDALLASEHALHDGPIGRHTA